MTALGGIGPFGITNSLAPPDVRPPPINPGSVLKTGDATPDCGVGNSKTLKSVEAEEGSTVTPPARSDGANSSASGSRTRTRRRMVGKVTLACDSGIVTMRAQAAEFDCGSDSMGMLLAWLWIRIGAWLVRRFRTRRRCLRRRRSALPVHRRTQAKPAWVTHEIIRLKALMPDAGCRSLALIFNRRYAASRRMTVGKSFVADTIRRHRYEIEVERRRIKHRVTSLLPRNRVWAMDMTGKTDSQGKLHMILGVVDHGTRGLLTLARTANGPPFLGSFCPLWASNYRQNGLNRPHVKRLERLSLFHIHQEVFKCRAQFRQMKLTRNIDCEHRLRL